MKCILSCSFVLFVIYGFTEPVLAVDSLRSVTKYGFMTVQGYPFAASRGTKNIPEEKQPKEDESWENIWNNILTSFSMPFGDFSKKDASTDIVNISLGLNVPLREKHNSAGAQTQGERLINTSLTASISYIPFGNWFINLSFFKYLSTTAKNPWDPDFSYRFGYDDWHPYTFSLVYWSTAGNKFNTAENRGALTHLSEGTITLGWKFPAAKQIERLVAINESSGLAHSVDINLTPRYDLESGGQDTWKTSLSLSTKYSIISWFYLTFTLYYYPIPRQQQSWDPDFTYGFGFASWQSNTISIQYNNYGGNKYPWKPKSSHTSDIWDGSLSLSWSYTF